MNKHAREMHPRFVYSDVKLFLGAHDGRISVSPRPPIFPPTLFLRTGEKSLG